MIESSSYSARYYDGITGQPHDVILRMGGSVLHIFADEAQTVSLASWSLNDIRVLERPVLPMPGILSTGKNPDCRLLIEAGKGWNHIFSRIPKANKPRITLPTHFGAYLVYSLISVVVLFFLIMVFPRMLESAAYIIPASVENMLGEHIANSVITQKICVEPAGQKALDRLVARLQENTNRNISYKIRVIDEPYEMNAFAAPGGHIVFYSAVIEKAESPDEAAGVLGHEMAHVELYHTTKGLIRDFGFSAVLGMMFGDATLVDVAGVLGQMHYSREDEAEADIRGTEILEASNIDPDGLSRFFKRLQEEEFMIQGLDFLNYFSTHPETGQRIRAIEQKHKGQKYTQVLSVQDWQALKNICLKKVGRKNEKKKR